MRILFKILFILLGIIIVIPALIFVLLIDTSKPPVKVYEENKDFEIMEIFGGALDHMLANAEENDLELNLTEDQLNTFIYQQLRNLNPNYLIDNEPENAYFMKEDYGGLVGIWSTLKKDSVTFKIRADLLTPFKISSSISLKFKFTLNAPNDNKYMTLQMESAKIGKFTLPRNLVNWVAEKAGLDLKEQVEDVLNINGVQIGEFSVDTWNVKVDKFKLAEALLGDNQDTAIFITLVKVLTVNNLIDIDFAKDNITAKFNSTKLYLDESVQQLTPDLLLHDEDEKNLMLSNKKVDLLLSAFVSDTDTLSVNLTEMDMNRILDYYFYGLGNLDQDIDIMGEAYELLVSSPWVDIKDGKIKLNIQIQLSNVLDPTQKFVTVFVIDIEANQSGSDVTFELGGLAVGKDVTLSKEDTQGILDILEASDFVDENMMVINEFLTKFSTENMTAKGSTIKDGYILLLYEGNTADAKEAISDVKVHIGDALAAIMPNYPQLATEYNAFISKTNPTMNDLQTFLTAIHTKLGDDLLEVFGQELMNALVVAKLGTIVPQLPGFPSVFPSNIPSGLPTFIP